MRSCNVCLKEKSYNKFKNLKKKTCKKCEYRFKQRILRYLVESRKISIEQKLATRIGYMGSGFLIAAQWTIQPELYIIGFILVVIQTSSRKQWNLVALNINGLIAWIGHLIM